MLLKQLIPIVFGQGIKTKIDPKQQMLGTFRKAQNIVFETLNVFKKRKGFSELVLRTAAGSVLSSQYITKYKNELLAISSNTLYGYSPSLNKAISRGPLHSVVPTTTAIVNNSINHVQVDMQVVGNFAIFARVTQSGQVWVQALDTTNNSFLTSDMQVASSGATHVQVAAINNTVFVIYNNSGTILYKYFNLYNPSTLSGPVTLTSTFSTSSTFKAVGSSDKIAVAFGSTNVSSRVQLTSIDSSNNPAGGFGISSSPAPVAITLTKGPAGRYILAYASATAAYYALVNGSLSALTVGPVLLETISDISNITLSASSSTYKIYYEVAGAQPYFNYIKQITATDTGTVGTPSVFKRGLGLAGDAFIYNSKTYIPCVYGSSIQSTNFILDDSAVIVTKYAQDSAGSVLTKGVVPKSFISNDQARLCTLYKTGVSTANGTFFSVLGVYSSVLDFTNSFKTALLGNNLHIAGGLLQMYDGANVVEHGFHVYPEKPTYTVQSSGGFIASGNYGILAVYKWTDNVGQDHYSVPSLSADVVVTTGSNHSIDVVVPTLKFIEKENVFIEIYRTEDAGTTFYLETSVANNPAVDTVTATCTLSDADLISKQLLYTTGGILENTAPPTASVIGVHTASNRLFMVSENQNKLQYSKIREDGKPVEWNDALLIDVDPVGGPITAVSSMDEKLIVFEETACFYISGAGPNNAGEQNSFTDPERISVDVGCTEPESVILTPAGLLFKSNKGIYMLNRALGIEYIGADVEAYNSQTIVSARLVPDVNQVRFTCSDGDMLVYNFYTGQWATFANAAGLASEVVDNVFYYLRTDGTVFVENSQYSDNTSTVSMNIETGWMTFGALQGYQRVYKMLIFGAYKSAHKLRVQVAYDFNEAWVQDVIVDPLQFLDGSTYGSDSPYGTSVYGGTGNIYQARIDFKQQKCQAVKVRITELQDEAGEGLEISGITLQIGLKSGTNKLSTSRKFGIR